MKRLLSSAALALSFLSVPAFADGAPATRAHAKVWLDGDSTVRAFRCDARNVDARLRGVDEIGALAELANARVTGSIRILVSSLDCANGTMNAHLRDALEMRKHPEIVLELKSVEAGAPRGEEVPVSAHATLRIAGASRPVVLRATARMMDGGLRVTGGYRLKMTDYGVEPPSLMLGTMKVRDEVTIGFELFVPAPKEAGEIVVGALW